MNFLKPKMFLFLLLLVGCLQNRPAPPDPINCDVPQLQKIPNKPLEGIVYGKRVRGVTRAYLTLNDFKIIQPVLSNEEVALPRKAEISIDTIIYPLASYDGQTNAKLYEGKTFKYGLGKNLLPERRGGDTFGLSFLEKDGKYSDSHFVEGNYKFLMQFGKLNQGKIPVKLYLCASSLATQISGTFDVEFGNEPSVWKPVNSH